MCVECVYVWSVFICAYARIEIQTTKKTKPKLYSNQIPFTTKTHKPTTTTKRQPNKKKTIYNSTTYQTTKPTNKPTN